VRLARERREQAELKRLEELRESIARHQEIRRKQEEERRRRMDEMKKREEEHRNMVEERRRRLQDEENVRTAPVSVLLVIVRSGIEAVTALICSDRNRTGHRYSHLLACFLVMDRGRNAANVHLLCSDVTYTISTRH